MIVASAASSAAAGVMIAQRLHAVVARKMDKNFMIFS
jgi:hypothetical protein